MRFEPVTLKLILLIVVILALSSCKQ